MPVSLASNIPVLGLESGCSWPRIFCVLGLEPYVLNSTSGVTMHLVDTSTVRSVVSELQTSSRNVLARYGTSGRLVGTFKQRTEKVPVPSQKALTVQAYWTFLQKLGRTVLYYHACSIYFAKACNKLAGTHFRVIVPASQRWQPILIRPGFYCFFLEPDSASLEDKGPDLILRITFKQG